MKLLSASTFANKTLNHAQHVPEPVVLGQPLAIIDAKHLHALMVHQIRQQLGRDQEVLPDITVARNVDKLVVNSTFSSLIHTLTYKSGQIVFPGKRATYLIDLVHEGERRPSLLRQTHEVQDRGERSFLTTTVSVIRDCSEGDSLLQTASAQSTTAASQCPGI